MIKVKINANKQWDEIIIKGHALYDDYGKDIVCSAVSSIVITTINGILSINDKSLTYNQGDGVISIKYDKQDLITNKLISNMLNLLKELELTYPNNIKCE